MRKIVKRKGGEIVQTSAYIVKCIVFDYITHESYGISYENINLIENKIFSQCDNEFQIEDRYEQYWNRLNGIDSNWQNDRKDIVKVIEVYPLEEFISKYPEISSNMDRVSDFYSVQSLNIIKSVNNLIK